MFATAVQIFSKKDLWGHALTQLPQQAFVFFVNRTTLFPKPIPASELPPPRNPAIGGAAAPVLGPVPTVAEVAQRNFANAGLKEAPNTFFKKWICRSIVYRIDNDRICIKYQFPLLEHTIGSLFRTVETIVLYILGSLSGGFLLCTALPVGMLVKTVQYTFSDAPVGIHNN